MNNTLASILVKAREIDKKVAVKHLAVLGLNEMDLYDLEDDGLLTVIRTKTDGMHLILTPEGYRQYA